MVNLNYHQTTTNLNNHQSQQIISVNQFSNQTYIINNIQADNLKPPGGNLAIGTGQNQLNSNYNNSYFNSTSWPSPVIYNHQTDLNSFNQISTHLVPSSSSSSASLTYLPSSMQPSLQQTQQLTSIQQTPPTTSSIEDSLEDSVRDLIKNIYKFYQLELSPSILLKKDFLTNKNYYNRNMPNHNHNHANANNQLVYQLYNTRQTAYTNSSNDASSYYFNLNEILEYFGWYASRISCFLSFMDHFPGMFYLRLIFNFFVVNSNFSSEIEDFQQLSLKDKEELVKSSIHSVILLSIQRRCDHYNYFNCDQSKFERYLKVLPVFSKVNMFMKLIHEKFEKFKLDDKEYALYTTLLIVSTGL